MDGYKLIKEKEEMNALVMQKDDVENPIFRVDLIIENVTPKQLYEALKDQTQVPQWFGKCLYSKLHSTTDDQQEIYQTVFKSMYPLNNRELIHRRIVQASENFYMISFSTLGLEQLQSKTKQKFARGYNSLWGMVIKAGVFDQKGEVMASKVFYVSQMEFAGQYVPVSAQVKAVPGFMIEFLERLIERAQKIKL